MSDFDIPAILNELAALGVSNAKVAKELNVCRSSVCKWKQGGEIKLRHWKELIGLRGKIITPVACQETT